MAQIKELLEKEEIKDIKEVKEDLIQEASVKGNSGKISKGWILVAAIVAAILIFK